MNDTMDHLDFVGTSTCDQCGDQCIGTHLHDAVGCQVLFSCANCMPRSFERVARADIDKWVAGGDVKFCS